MNTATIEDLAYLLKQAKIEGLPQPIVFLGAGASKTGGVPLARDIVKDILKIYKENPKVKALPDEAKSYAKLMECLTPFERNKLLKGYIDNAKINVTHIYLAQFMIEGYVDYVLTVNFDNLMLRALALFNNFPATYDMAILKDLTTTNFKEKSVVYLHGQHHGLWLLNTQEEMNKVNEIIPPILNSIKDRRPWIFVGYSGEDPIFEHILKLGRFDNGLYWVTYKDNTPNNAVCTELLEKANTNTFLIKGYDSDSFMLRLNSVLNLPQPKIIDKPFSSLKNTLENIVDIDDDEHFKGVKERLEIVKDDVKKAIRQFEEGIVETNENLKDEIDIGLLKKQIIDIRLSEEYKEDEIEELSKIASKISNNEINEQLSDLYNEWGVAIFDLAKLQNSESLYQKSIEKYETATILNPKNYYAFNNWGNAILDLAKLQNSESLYQKSFEKYETATTLNPQYYEGFNNWGIAILRLAKLQNSESLYQKSFEKYETATILNPQFYEGFNNWGIAILGLAKLQNSESLYQKSIEKYKTATILNPKYESAFSNWGSSLIHLFKLTQKADFLDESIEKSLKSIQLGGSSYNLSCAYSLKKDKENALRILEQCLIKKEETINYIESDDDWEKYWEDEDFKALLEKYS
jgi:tetratricopeptide (TPR) repeat protein